MRQILVNQFKCDGRWGAEFQRGLWSFKNCRKYSYVTIRVARSFKRAVLQGLVFRALAAVFVFFFSLNASSSTIFSCLLLLLMVSSWSAWMRLHFWMHLYFYKPKWESLPLAIPYWGQKQFGESQAVTEAAVTPEATPRPLLYSPISFKTEVDIEPLSHVPVGHLYDFFGEMSI